MAELRCLNCLNCDGPLAAEQRFCARCGQRTDTARLSTLDMLRELMHSFVNVERGPLTFAWALLVRPGVVAREYVQGRRRRHYGPFATLVVLVGATALAVNLSGLRVLAQDGLDPAPADLLQRHFNLLLLAQLPLLGAACALLFRGARLTLPEHMVLAAYALSVRALVLMLVLPLSYFAARSEPPLATVIAYWVAWYVYYGWTASQFYAGNRFGVWARGIAAAVLAHGAIHALLQIGGWLYPHALGGAGP